MTTWRTCLFVMEVLHAYWHVDVLVTGGGLHQSDLYNRGWYFVWDMMTPLVSQLFVTVAWPVRLFLLLHTVQHLYYIVHWRSRALHVETVVEWSVLPWSEKVRRPDHISKTLGTMMDIGVHLMMAWLHIS